MQPNLNFQGRNANPKPTSHNEDLQAKSKELIKSQKQKEVTEKKNHAESPRTITLHSLIRKVKSNRKAICVEYL